MARPAAARGSFVESERKRGALVASPRRKRRQNGCCGAAQRSVRVRRGGTGSDGPRNRGWRPRQTRGIACTETCCDSRYCPFTKRMMSSIHHPHSACKYGCSADNLQRAEANVSPRIVQICLGLIWRTFGKAQEHVRYASTTNIYRRVF